MASSRQQQTTAVTASAFQACTKFHLTTPQLPSTATQQHFAPTQLAIPATNNTFAFISDDWKDEIKSERSLTKSNPYRVRGVPLFAPKNQQFNLISPQYCFRQNKLFKIAKSQNSLVLNLGIIVLFKNFINIWLFAIFFAS